MLSQLLPLFPKQYNNYYEPFLGGGAVFFSGIYVSHKAFLSDYNEEIINCYKVIRDDVDSLIKALALHRYEEKYYYSVRSTDPKSISVLHRAARTIFLNKTGFNGLYRVNKSGKFNVPFGKYVNPTICDKDNLIACSKELKGVDLFAGDFQQSTEFVRANDLVYFDPPYVPVSETCDFTSYTKNGFGEKEQKRLALEFDRLAKLGAHVLLSNSDTPLVRELYKGHEIVEVQASRNINSKGAKRGKVGEVVVIGKRNR